MPSATRRQPAPRHPDAPRAVAVDPAVQQAKRVRLSVAWTIGAVTFLLYLPVLLNGSEFVQLEDYRYVVENPIVRGGLSRESLQAVPTAVVAGNWHPVTLLSHMLDVQLFDVRPTGHHTASLLLHAANAGLLFYVLARMTRSVWPSAVAAALFACHPLAVEPVVWIAARKDVLSTFFWMLTLWAYAAYVERPQVWKYALIVLALAAGLMAKPMLVTLPFVLLLLDYWPLRRLPDEGWTSPAWRKAAGALVREKLPLFALVWLSCLVTLWAQWSQGSGGTTSWGTRFSNAVQTYYVYLLEAVWPVGLYLPHPHPDQLRIGWGMIALGTLGLVAVTACCFWLRRRAPFVTVGWLWYLGTLVPVLGLVEVGLQAYPDRFAYVPLVGIYLIVAWGLESLAARSDSVRRLATVGAGVVVLALAISTYLQIGHWQNSIALFEHAVQCSDRNFVAQALLGNSYFLAKRYDDALEQFDDATEAAPYFAQAYYNRGQVLLARGNESQYDYNEAEKSFDSALRLNFDKHATLVGLATAALRQQHADDAEKYAREALAIKPDSVTAIVVLAGVAVTRNDGRTAAEWYRRAKDLRPNAPSLLNSLARIYATCEDDEVRQGVAAVDLAERANGFTQYKFPEMIDTLAAAYAERGRFAEAEEAIGLALQLAEAQPEADADKQEQLVASLKEHRELYRLKLPLREPVNVREPILP
ncbi:MAG: tetratricopeptide repeat protein [Pirellulales bacterium]|nr:tetratricopeptide repeat protein [Pirellulales bacterium]